jgi:hypothetical protein
MLRPPTIECLTRHFLEREREREENREDYEEAGEYGYFLFSGVRVMALVGNLVREWRPPLAIYIIYSINAN